MKRINDTEKQGLKVCGYSLPDRQVPVMAGPLSKQVGTAVGLGFPNKTVVKWQRSGKDGSVLSYRRSVYRPLWTPI